MVKCLIAAGGTGGHIFPALAVADQLSSRGVEVHWVGSRGRLEEKIVPQHYPIDYLSVQALRGKSKLSALLAPFKLSRALLQACRLIRQHRPAFVLAMGGYVCGPIGLAAWLMRVPLVVHEQNAAAGFTNRCLRPLAATVLQAFANSFPARNADIAVVGNPVRQMFWDIAEPKQRLDVQQSQLRILVVGGSQGARFINQQMPLLLRALSQQVDVACWHQAGKLDLDAVEAAYENVDCSVKVAAFIDDMAQAYAWTDVVICRAGALTVSEIAAAGVAAIFVPLPIAVDDHQRKNAQALVAAGAAKMVLQSQWDQAELLEWLTTWQKDRNTLLALALAAKAQAQPDAVHRVTNACMAYVEEERHAIKE